MLKRFARSRPRELSHAPEPAAHDGEKQSNHAAGESEAEARRDAEAPLHRERHWAIRDLAGFEFPFDP